MNAQVSPHWLANPTWQIEVLHDHLVVNGGADEVYVVDEAPAAAHQTLIDICANGDAYGWRNDAVLGAAIRQLRRVGALVPAGALLDESMALSIRWIGAELPALVEALESHGWRCLPAKSDDSHSLAPLVLLVRTTASWSELLSSYQIAPLKQTHVLLDLAYHHTVGIGPMVVPGETACLACMGHRILRRWDDMQVPQQPAIMRRAAGVAALLADAAVLGPRLIERALTLDLRNLRMEASRVFVQPGCPVCAACATAYTQPALPLPLPWLVSEPGVPHDQAAHTI